MSFEADEEILQDFLIEAGEILESLSEQLVELENDPDNADLLNAIFRGFHTVKGGAGFLSLTELVDVCHGAENIFDLLRNNQRTVTSDLMDVILQATDSINEMFAQVQNGEALTPAEPELIAELHRLSEPEGQEVAAAPEPVVEAAPVAEPEAVPAAGSSSDEMSEDEFERLLDELHGNGSPSAPAAATPVSSSDSNDISDDEFESLLDELHGQGAFSSNVAAPSPAPVSSNSDEIDDEEFENLLDEIHGKGKAPQPGASVPTAAPTPTPVPQAKPAAAPKAASKPAAKPAAKKPVAKDKKAAQPAAPQGETTVRVDTKRLDQIMNMVGELVLVRNRLTSLGMTKEDEELTKAVSNLDAVTTDLQGAVMKTRMQPIKKVFGRFPRVVRDLARSLNKEIKLVLEGEDTDLDKNLVEAWLIR